MPSSPGRNGGRSNERAPLLPAMANSSSSSTDPNSRSPPSSSSSSLPLPSPSPSPPAAALSSRRELLAAILALSGPISLTTVVECKAIHTHTSRGKQRCEPVTFARRALIRILIPSVCDLLRLGLQSSLRFSSPRWWATATRALR